MLHYPTEDARAEALALYREKTTPLHTFVQTALWEQVAEAFRVGLYHQAVAGTSLIAPSALGKLDQRMMKTSFSSILRLLELTTSTFVASA